MTVLPSWRPDKRLGSFQLAASRACGRTKVAAGASVCKARQCVFCWRTMNHCCGPSYARHWASCGQRRKSGRKPAMAWKHCGQAGVLALWRRGLQGNGGENPGVAGGMSADSKKGGKRRLLWDWSAAFFIAAVGFVRGAAVLALAAHWIAHVHHDANHQCGQQAGSGLPPVFR